MGAVVGVGAQEESAAVVEPGEGAFDDPAVSAQAGAVLGLAAGDLGFDPALPELAAVLVVVVAAVAGQPVGAVAWPADLAAHRRDTLDERDQLRDVVAVATREPPGERDPRGVDEEVVLGARSAAVNWARARRAAPFFACT